VVLAYGNNHECDGDDESHKRDYNHENNEKKNDDHKKVYRMSNDKYRSDHDKKTEERGGKRNGMNYSVSYHSESQKYYYDHNQEDSRKDRNYGREEKDDKNYYSYRK